MKSPSDLLRLADIGYLGDCWKAWAARARSVLLEVYGINADSSIYTTDEQRDRLFRCGVKRAAWTMFTQNTPPSIYAYWLACVLSGNSMTIRNAFAEKER